MNKQPTPEEGAANFIDTLQWDYNSDGDQEQLEREVAQAIRETRKAAFKDWDEKGYMDHGVADDGYSCRWLLEDDGSCDCGFDELRKEME